MTTYLLAMYCDPYSVVMSDRQAVVQEAKSQLEKYLKKNPHLGHYDFVLREKMWEE